MGYNWERWQQMDDGDYKHEMDRIAENLRLDVEHFEKRKLEPGLEAWQIEYLDNELRDVHAAISRLETVRMLYAATGQKSRLDNIGGKFWRPGIK